MNDMKELLVNMEWLDQEAGKEPELEFLEHEKAIASHKETRKNDEEEMQELLASLKFQSKALEEEMKAQSVFAADLAAQGEKELASPAELDEMDVIQQVKLETGLDVQTVVGGGPGRYFDFSPYRGWGRVYTHNEGGHTSGSAGYSLAARKMYPYAHARGDGSGISDDNDVTTWTKLYFAFWPRQNGHVRAYVPYYTRGYFQIYANDKWYNSKEAKVDLDVSVNLYQNYWGGYAKDDVFRLSDDNINRNGRIDLNRSLYSGSLAIGAGKWVIAEVAVKARVETEGSGSTAILNFRSPDSIYVPYVRFDFS